MKLSSTLLLSAACAAASLLPTVAADIYLHYPPGSNNRLNENNRNVQNNARLFDSQDNNRGGYLQGSEAGAALQFYAGSQVPIQWTTQHSCGTAQDNCEVIVQYMISEGLQGGTTKSLRDGTNTNTMPANGDADAQYGRHESRAYYDECKNTIRNKGLFVADQAMNNNVGRTATRQNSNGNQRGNECAEERDYYPTTVPNAWRDAAIITNNQARCAEYKALSQNVAPVYKCVGSNTPNAIPITQATCTAKAGQWQAVAAKGLAAPECLLNTQSARDNSLSVVDGTNGTAATYMWTIPADAAGKDVVVRIRYNISTGEYYDPTTGGAEFKDARTGADLVDARFNANAAGAVTGVPIWEKLGLTKAEVQATIKAGNAAAAKAAAAAAQQAGALTAAVTTRGYVVSNNPNVDMFGALLNNGNPITGVGKVRVQLATNLAQWGRTFEDRSHVFSVASAASNPVVKAALDAGKKVVNVGLMGHRGNQQQVYPALELQFTQKEFKAELGDVVQFQWSLSKNNPANNAVATDGITGQANGVDKANIVMIEDPTYARLNSVEGGNPFQYGAMGRMKPASIVDPANSFLGLAADKLKQLATGSATGATGGNNGIAYNSGPIAITKEGDFAFMSTMSSLANVRTAKALLSVVGPSYLAFKRSTVAQNAVVRQIQAASASAPPADSEQAFSQASLQAVNSANPNSKAAQLAFALAFGQKEPAKKSVNVALIAGIVGGIAALIILTLIAYTIYARKATAAAQKAPQAAAYQVRSSTPVQQPQGVQKQSSAQKLPVMQQKPMMPAQQWQSDRARVASNYV